MGRKGLCLIMASLLLVCLTGCVEKKDSDSPKDKHHEMIREARDALLEKWEEAYRTDRGIESDGTVQIKNTRLLVMKENENKYFKDVAYIVEFVVFSDYFGSAPYYMNVGVWDSVVVYKNGTMDVRETSLIRAYGNRVYSYDLSDFLKEVKDYETAYNLEKKLKQDQRLEGIK